MCWPRSRSGTEDWHPSGGCGPGSWPHDACKQCPGTRRWAELGCCLCTAERHLTLAGLQIWSIEIRIALPEVRRFTHVVAWRECLWILPNTPKTNVVLKVFANAWKVLHARYSQPLQFGVVTNSRQHQHKGANAVGNWTKPNCNGWE